MGFQAGVRIYNQRDGYNYSRSSGRGDRHDYAYGSGYPDRGSNVVIVNPRQYQDQYYEQDPYQQPYVVQQVPNSALQSRTLLLQQWLRRLSVIALNRRDYLFRACDDRSAP